MTNLGRAASHVPNLAAIRLRDLDEPDNAEQVAAVCESVGLDRGSDDAAPLPVAAFNASL